MSPETTLDVPIRQNHEGVEYNFEIYQTQNRSIKPTSQIQFQTNRTEAEYLDGIEDALNAINAGENYQLCLTNQLEAFPGYSPSLNSRQSKHESGPFGDKSLHSYLKLRVENPAPFSAYFR